MKQTISSQQLSQWYNTIIFEAGLADNAPTRGCIVMMPYGYAIWENLQSILDTEIKKRGAVNAAFPLLIPQSMLAREADHVEGFSPELAVVTHAGGKELEEPLVVRPTSETIIHAMFARWIHSWRDLPYKINQWCSVVRWEMRPRAFLRTTEFWWQEGHTVHATYDDAYQCAQEMHDMYRTFMEGALCIPVVAAQKPAHERFAGAEDTLTLEAMMPDGKALQMGTSHMLSQSFAKAAGITFQSEEGKEEFPYLTSWGVTTRLIGALTMVHGDEKGLKLPSKIAPTQVVIIPIFKSNADDINTAIKNAIEKIAVSLRNAGIRIYIDSDTHERPGAKFYKWEQKGVPLRIELGARDVENGVITLFNRATGEKSTINIAECTAELILQKMTDYDTILYDNAYALLNSNQKVVARVHDIDPEYQGWYKMPWDPQATQLVPVLKEQSLTIRCIIPNTEYAPCGFSGNKTEWYAIIAKAY